MAPFSLDPPAVANRFGDLCRLVGARGRGFTLRDLAHCHAMARELESPQPDRGKIADHAYALGLDAGSLQ